MSCRWLPHAIVVITAICWTAWIDPSWSFMDAYEGDLIVVGDHTDDGTNFTEEQWGPDPVASRTARETNVQEIDAFLRDVRLDMKNPPRDNFVADDNFSCAEKVNPWDPLHMQASPQAIHTAMLAHFQDMHIVELGSGTGDGITCFAKVAKSAVSIEADTSNCRKLWLRSWMLRLQGLHSYNVLCGPFPKKFRDADVFTWWQDLGFPAWRNVNILRTLKSLQDDGHVQKTAKAVMIFDVAVPIDRFSFQQLRSLFSWVREVEHHNEGNCSDYGWEDDSFNCLRTSGSFLIAGMPISAATL